jgi:DNA-binding NarL/FixJ family response regulator
MRRTAQTLTVETTNDDATGACSRSVAVLIVDDQNPFRRVARMVVTVTPGFHVMAEAITAEGALEAVEAQCPDLVLMDINLPGISGIDATRQITRAHPDVVLLLSTYAEVDLPADAHSCGALAYVNKEDFGSSVISETWSRH